MPGTKCACWPTASIGTPAARSARTRSRTAAAFGPGRPVNTSVIHSLKTSCTPGSTSRVHWNMSFTMPGPSRSMNHCVKTLSVSLVTSQMSRRPRYRPTVVSTRRRSRARSWPKRAEGTRAQTHAPHVGGRHDRLLGVVEQDRKLGGTTRRQIRNRAGTARRGRGREPARGLGRGALAIARDLAAEIATPRAAGATRLLPLARRRPTRPKPVGARGVAVRTRDGARLDHLATRRLRERARPAAVVATRGRIDVGKPGAVSLARAASERRRRDAALAGRDARGVRAPGRGGPDDEAGEERAGEQHGR